MKSKLLTLMILLGCISLSAQKIDKCIPCQKERYKQAFEAADSVFQSTTPEEEKIESELLKPTNINFITIKLIMSQIEKKAFEAYQKNRKQDIKYQIPDNFWMDWYKQGYNQAIEDMKNESNTNTK